MTDSRAANVTLNTQTERPAGKRSFDAVGASAAALFVIAIVAAAYPAFRAGPTTGPGLLLLMGLAGVAFIGIFAFGSSEPKGAVERQGWGEMLDALGEPAAVLSNDGRVLHANSGWAAAFGGAKRLPKTSEAGGLYAALNAAKRGDIGRAELIGGAGERASSVTRFGDRRFLIRAAEPPPAPASPQRVEASNIRPAEIKEPMVAAIAASFDGFAAAAPFGAAALDGGDPLDAVIAEANTALEVMTQGRAKPGVRFGDLLDAGS
ncbi:MAG: hybrid sensor histidine kinase/response regulator, partial [Proteobacteria bacterium]|nr:hybrid sensor histidine kinase/response regulator [Pseudomonadota bacterium]